MYQIERQGSEGKKERNNDPNTKKRGRKTGEGGKEEQRREEGRKADFGHTCSFKGKESMADLLNTCYTFCHI